MGAPMTRYEFDVELKSASRQATIPGASAQPVPPIRRTLVTAYQIADYMWENNMSMFKTFCHYAHISQPRATQIMKMLHLSPRIQEQILMDNDPQLFKLSEVDIRTLLHETSWALQEELWGNITQTAL